MTLLADDDDDKSRPVLANLSGESVQEIKLPSLGTLAEKMDAFRAALGPCPHCGR